MQAPSGVAKFCIASLAMSPQLPEAMHASGHCACIGGFAQLMPNWLQKSSPHIEALLQASSQALTTPVEDEAATDATATELDAPGPVPTDADAFMVAPLLAGPPVVVIGPVMIDDPVVPAAVTALEATMEKTMPPAPPAPPAPPSPFGPEPSTTTLPPQAPMKPATTTPTKVIADIRE